MGNGFMTSSQVCEYMNCSGTLLNKLEREGLLKPRRKLPINKKRLYLQEDVDAYLESLIVVKQSDE